MSVFGNMFYDVRVNWTARVRRTLKIAKTTGNTEIYHTVLKL